MSAASAKQRTLSIRKRLAGTRRQGGWREEGVFCHKPLADRAPLTHL